MKEKRRKFTLEKVDENYHENAIKEKEKNWE
jgi:hypothetical protein